MKFLKTLYWVSTKQFLEWSPTDALWIVMSDPLTGDSLKICDR